jgi:hypothetical protein
MTQNENTGSADRPRREYFSSFARTTRTRMLPYSCPSIIILEAPHRFKKPMRVLRSEPTARLCAQVSACWFASFSHCCSTPRVACVNVVSPIPHDHPSTGMIRQTAPRHAYAVIPSPCALGLAIGGGPIHCPRTFYEPTEQRTGGVPMPSEMARRILTHQECECCWRGPTCILGC